MIRRRLSTCKWCCAPVRWVITDKGHHLAIDSHPVSDGNLIMTIGKWDRPQVHIVRPGEDLPPGQLLWIAHSATCPSRQAARTRDRYAPHAVPPTIGEQLRMPPPPERG